MPARCYRKHGSYYYVDRARKWHRLGKTVPEALTRLAELQTDSIAPSTMGEVFERYERHVLPTKSARTQKTDSYCLSRIRPVFKHMPPDTVKPHHVWQYWENRGSSRQARLEVGVLSHCFTMAMRWGLAQHNPCRGLQIPKNAPRRRYVTNAEFLAVRETAPERLKLAMDIGLATGLRLTDILALSPESLGDEGLVVDTSKTGTALCFTWTPELRAEVERWLALSPITESGFETAWQRLMRPLPKEQRWQFRDLRAKSASDSETLDSAAQRLGHTNAAITRRVYYRRPLVVATLAKAPKKKPELDKLDEKLDMGLDKSA